MKRIDYEQIAKDLLTEHNILRTNPKSYIEKLEKCRDLFHDNVYHQPGEDPLQTYEGKAAIEEAIEFLKKQEKVPKLEVKEEISKACRDHINDIGPKGLTTHEGSDGSNISDRLEKHCEWDGACAENIDFGFKKPENILINMLVDDGVKQRYQRINLFNKDLKYFGAAVGEHKNYGICAVVGYTKGIRKLGEEPTEVANFIQDYIKNTMNRDKGSNPFQEDDPDAPDDTKSVKILKETKVFNNRTRKITKKIYTLSNGANHIVEIEDS